MFTSSHHRLAQRQGRSAAHGRSGAVWKIAYADFVTAMMAFFLVLWLVNTTDPDQKRGIAEYFSPPNISATTSGFGGALAGRSAATDGPQAADGARRQPVDPMRRPALTDDGADSGGPAKREITTLAAEVRQVLSTNPEILALAPQVAMEPREDGIALTIFDPAGVPMFRTGSAALTPAGEAQVRALGIALAHAGGTVAITGHAARGEAEDAWTLSAMRAATARAVLVSAGIAPDRIAAVTGAALTDPLTPADPDGAVNARVVLVVAPRTPAIPAGFSLTGPALP